MAEAPPRPERDLERLAIDTVRVLAMDAVQRATSGHPGTPMALAPVAYELFTRHLRHNPANPDWVDRDRFVLSAGHASMLLYAVLHLTGYDLGLDEIRQFRQWGSRTAGHPEYRHPPGVETTTGPLGQGVANSVGMALAERWLAAYFNRPGHAVVDHYTYALCSDGDLMEGISHECAELAGHHKLGKLIWVFDDNRITIEGSTDLATSTDQRLRFQGYGWQVLQVDDGEDLTAIDRALQTARAETSRPTLIILRTTIAWGSPNKAGTAATHGAPLGEDEVAATRANLGYPSNEPFYVDPDARRVWENARSRGDDLESGWQTRLEAYRRAHPELAAELRDALAGTLPDGWDAELDALTREPRANATRTYSGQVIQAIAAALPNFLGGSADLGGSNKTDIDGAPSLSVDTPDGRVMHFGVREHAMGGILSGMALHGGLWPFGGTFLIFSDYMRPSIRLAAMMGLPVRYVFTHDSIGLGEDGPTHQPVEHLASLRAIPGLMDLRPADMAETVEAWRAAVNRIDGPSFLALSRQKVPVLDRDGLASAEGLHRGAYVVAEASGGSPDAILIASGSELSVALRARDALELGGVATRVVSMPSWFLFEAEDEEYRQAVLPSSVPVRVSVEAGSSMGWSRWVGPAGGSVALDRFGASAPAATLFQKLGFTADDVVAVTTRLLESTRSRTPA